MDCDPRYSNYRELNELPDFILREIRNFFENYKVLQGIDVTTGDYHDKEDAIKIIDECKERYKRKNLKWVSFKTAEAFSFKASKFPSLWKELQDEPWRHTKSLLIHKWETCVQGDLAFRRTFTYLWEWTRSSEKIVYEQTEKEKSSNHPQSVRYKDRHRTQFLQVKRCCANGIP